MDENNIKEFKEVAQELLGWDKRAIHTVRKLLLKPGYAVEESIAQPEKYISPWVYFFAVEAFAFYVFSFGLFQNGMKDMDQGLTDFFLIFGINWKEKNNGQFISYLQSEIGYKLFVPFLMVLRWLFFKKFVSSFKSNCFFVLYMMATTDLFAVTAVVWYLHPPQWVFSGAVFAVTLYTLIYMLWGTRQFYHISLGAAILWTSLTYALLYIIKFSIFLLVAIVMNAWL